MGILSKTEIIDKVYSFARDYFKNPQGSHSWEHTLRVLKLCEKLAKNQKADPLVLNIAAYLHDIGRSYQDKSSGKICHAQKGAEIAGPFLEELPLTKRQKKNILHCIKTHRFRNSNPPQTREAKILFDADKLDSIGAIGIARAFLFAGEIGAKLHNTNHKIQDTQEYSQDDTGYREYMVKLKKVKGHIITREGKKLAQIRHDFMERFFKQFLQEHQGLS